MGRYDDTEAKQPMIPSGDTENYEVEDLLETKRRHWLYRRMVLPVLFCIAFFVVLIWWFRYIDITEESRRLRHRIDNFDAAPGVLLRSATTNFTVMNLLDTLEFPHGPRDYSESALQLEDPTIVEKPVLNLSRWTAHNKLKIFVVLFSHDDAGWQKTFIEYYKDQTKNILNNVLNYLTENPGLKFIWTEISFFDLWWTDLNPVDRERVKMIIDRKQLEFTAEGWVMPDEANVHYSSYLTQLFEGHQWLKEHLDYIPKNGWSIDPFGQSPSLTYLLGQSGVKNKVINRIHYIMKRYFRKHKNLEFFWRQQWDNGKSTDMFTHLLPYSSYDKGATCGPAGPYLCNTFKEEFPDIPNASLKFLEQYRMKAMLYNTNNLLLPLGGDFTWATALEWEGLKNYQKIMNFINSSTELFTEIKFSTLSEYFDAVNSDINQGALTPPSLSGDFFAYSDAGRDYWTGYYTSRAFHKATERQLMSLLRSAQILFTLTSAQVVKETHSLDHKFLKGLLEKIIESRRALSLFQHHDGIAGTSKDYVVVDYAKQLHTAMAECQFVIQQCLFYLNNRHKLKTEELAKIRPTAEFYEPTIHKTDYGDPWKHKIYTLNDSYPVVVIAIFNPLEYQRTEVIKLMVTSPSIMVLAMDGSEIQSEVYPVFQNFASKQFTDFLQNKSPNESVEENTVRDSQRTFLAHDAIFELNFLAELNPLEVTNFKLYYHPEGSPKRHYPRVRVFNTVVNASDSFKKIFNYPTRGEGSNGDVGEPVEIYNRYLTVRLNEDGFAKTIKLCGIPHKFNVGFYRYEPDWRSGLYSFSPSGPAETVEYINPVVVVVEGMLKSYAEVWHFTFRHRLTLFNHTGVDSHSVHVENMVDLRGISSYELAMRVSTGISSNHVFYTDSNGFQMFQRKFREDLPLQGNFYPVASSAFIEDGSARVTILAAQPSAGTSLKSGQLELMQDRRVPSDDGHGIGQGYTDNLVTLTKYRIILEPLSGPTREPAVNTVPVLSITAHHLLHSLLHPIQAFKSIYASTAEISPGFEHQFLAYGLLKSQGFPCDIHLVNTLPFLPSGHRMQGRPFATNSSLETKLRKEVAVVVHRLPYDGRFGVDKVSAICNLNAMGKLRLADLFGETFSKELKRTSISFLHEYREVWSTDEAVPMGPMEVIGLKACFANI